jgi:dienelactone hydrolase
MRLVTRLAVFPSRSGAISIAVAFALVMVAACTSAQTPPRINPADPATWPTGLAKSYHPPEGVDFRVVNIMSEGVRLHGELFSPHASAGKSLPTIIMAHGWGGVAAEFRSDAVDLTRAGFQVLTFDYRGWGESDSRVILTKPQPRLPADRKFTAKVEAIRGYVDPWEQAEDWLNAINWAAGEPAIDPERIGIRGSSYSGGLVVYVAARDPRVKVLVSQVGGIPARPDPASLPKPGSANYQRWLALHDSAVRMARGELGYPEPGAMVIGSLVGAPVGDQMLRWWPNEDARNITIPALFIVAENEELMNNKTNGILAYERVQGPKKLVIIPGIKHYGIYNEARAQAVSLAAAWFREYLK